ncbi:F-box WD repeat-containing 9, partial [Paramuricea clavata]
VCGDCLAWLSTSSDIYYVQVSAQLMLFTLNYYTTTKGWIWRLISDPVIPERFCSGSWDGYIKLWDLRSTKCAGSVDLRTHPICMTWRSNDTLVAGCFDKTVRLIDPRSMKI